MVTLTTLALIGMLNSTTPATNIENSSVYSRTMAVVDIDETEDTVTIADFNGMEWEFEGVEDYFIGDVVSCIMLDNSTPNIEDDIIASVNYCGWVDYWGYDIETKAPLYVF